MEEATHWRLKLGSRILAMRPSTLSSLIVVLLPADTHGRQLPARPNEMTPGLTRSIDVGDGEVDLLVPSALAGRERGDEVGDSGHKDLAGGGHEGGKDCDEVGHGLVDD